MGLDQYFYVKKNKGEHEEIGYLRKHSWIQGYMEQLWLKRGCPLPDDWDDEKKKEYEDKEFNCVPLELTLEDVKQLRKAIKGNKLKPVDGFFFGSGEPDKETAKEELKILKEVEERLKAGEQTFYDSWW
jgi:hypothetical protein